MARFKFNHQDVTLLASHPPPPVGTYHFDYRNDQLTKLAERINSTEGELILTGDLNTSSYSTHFKKLVNSTDLIDTRAGFGILPSWPTWFPLANITLDHCLISSGLAVKSEK